MSGWTARQLAGIAADGRRVTLDIEPAPTADGALDIDLHLPDCRSLKAKRAVLRPLVEGARRRFKVAVAEVGHQDQWQRARVGIATVSASEHHARDVIDEVERFVWAQPGVDVLSAARSWLEVDA